MTFKILSFDLDELQVKSNQLTLASVIRSETFQLEPRLADVFSGDEFLQSVFLEPMLFYTVMEVKKKSLLNQTLLGYFPSEITQTVSVFSDSSGVVYLPQIGYFNVSPNSECIIEYSFNENIVYVNGFPIDICGEQLMVGTSVKLYSHLPLILNPDYNNKISNSVTNSLLFHRNQIQSAFDIIKSNVPDFFRVIEDTVRCFSVFDAEYPNSFAAISYHGAAFFNTENSIKNEVFFIDDISHQCGHVIFNSLTLLWLDYVKYPKVILLKDIIPNCKDHRDLYSAFHGLFTYVCIINSLYCCVRNKCFKESIYYIESLARIGYYLLKLIADLETLHKKNIFTIKGQEFFDLFVNCYKLMYDEYNHITSGFTYRNQKYSFSFEAFISINSIDRL